MRKAIGRVIGLMGAHLWRNGGWTGFEKYEDLTVLGKLGYRMFCKGLELEGVSLEQYVSERKNKQ